LHKPSQVEGMSVVDGGVAPVVDTGVVGGGEGGVVDGTSVVGASVGATVGAVVTTAVTVVVVALQSQSISTTLPSAKQWPSHGIQLHGIEAAPTLM